MCEILFRGKRTNDGRWIEGYYMHHLNRMASPCDGIKPEDEDHIILNDGFADWNMPRDIVYTHVDPETVGQYTGLKDKNGNRIFEGDIIRYTDFLGCDRDAQVIFTEGSFGADHYFISAWLRDGAIGNTELRDVTVIGNVHDNPEMIGGKDNAQV